MARASLGVVVPTLDEERHLGPLLARLAGDDRVDGGAGDRADELIVVDGGSRDGTRELARAAGARVLLAARGRGGQLAAGARATRAEVLLFLHADCVPAPGALERVRAAFDDPTCMAAALAQRIDADGGFFRMVEACANARVRWRGMIYGDSGLVVRRALYEEVGGFRALPLFEDVDLSRRLRRRVRPRLLSDARLRVSARRWQREGALRATLRNWMIQTAYAAGVAPHRLERFYPAHARRAASA